jgi:hypothetical protein
MAPPKGLFEGRSRSPKETGAWVHGIYYPGGNWFPKGTVDFTVNRIFANTAANRANGGSAYFTISERFKVGTSQKAINAKLTSAATDLLNFGTSPKIQRGRRR